MTQVQTATPGVLVEIFSDPICPWCLIGWRRLQRARQLLGDLPVTVRWLPFELNPDMPAEGMGRREYLEAKFGGPSGAERVYGRIKAEGASDGIAFNFEGISRTPNTFEAHRLLWYAQRHGRGDVVAEVLFQRYFLEGGDIGAREALVDIAAQAGLVAAEVQVWLASAEGVDEVRALEREAWHHGVGGVPFFIVDRRFALSGAQPPELLAEALQRAGDTSKAAASPTS